MKEQILWAVKIGDEDWQEQMITNNPEKFEAAKQWAKSNGFDRFRISTIDLDTPPDFENTVRKSSVEDWKDDAIEFKISVDFVSAIIYDDPSNLEDDEEKMLDDFLTQPQYQDGYWQIDYDTLDYPDLYECEVTGLLSDCISIFFIPNKKEGNKSENTVRKSSADDTKLPIGKHNDVPDEEFDADELELGIEIEKEHTDNEEFAKAIAKDHLSEFSNYYSALTDMEDKLKEGK